MNARQSPISAGEGGSLNAHTTVGVEDIVAHATPADPQALLPLDGFTLELLGVLFNLGRLCSRNILRGRGQPGLLIENIR